MKEGPDNPKSSSKKAKSASSLRPASIRMRAGSSTEAESSLQLAILSPDFMQLGNEATDIEPGIQAFNLHSSRKYQEVETAYDCRVFDDDPPARKNNFLDLRKIIDISKSDKSEGLYTRHITECTFLGFVQLDKKNRPERISGFHFGGGLFASDLRESSIVIRKLLENFDRHKPLYTIIADGMSWGHLEGVHIAGPTLAETGARSEALKQLLRHHGFTNFNVTRTRAGSVLISFKEIPDLVHEHKRKLR